MPVRRVAVRERPADPLTREAPCDMRIVDDIQLVVVIDEPVVHRRAKDEGCQDQEPGADGEHDVWVRRVRARSGRTLVHARRPDAAPAPGSAGHRAIVGYAAAHCCLM
jgi:hypothetical protein